MTKDLISFVIMTYKNFDGIYDTLDSVFRQDYPMIEIIISDDGSPNAKEELPKIEAYINEHKTPNIVNVIINAIPENVGTVKNNNQALKLANGEYIKDLAAEDVLNDTNVLSKYKKFLDDSGCLVCVAKVRGVDENGNYHYNLASCEDNYKLLASYTPQQLRERLFRRNCLPAPAFFVKKELFEKHGYYSEETRLIEDYPYWLHLCEEGVKIAFFDERLIDYKLTGVSSAGHYSKMFMNDMLVIYEKHIFPYDKRFGIFQGFYNALKRGGLNAYIAIADWEDSSFMKKVQYVLKYGLFFAYIKLGNLMHRG